MKKNIFSFIVLFFSVVVLKAEVINSVLTNGSDGLAVSSCEKNISTKLWVHYMPWFADKETNGFWNHWNKSENYNTNPDIMDETGKRQIASHYYPLIGTYSTKNRLALEYHFLLMKYAGIDGITIDWYGTRNLYNYPVSKESTDTIVNVLQDVGLDFFIMYEDWTAAANSGDTIPNAKKDLLYCQNNYFELSNYVKINGKPLLATFGPRQITIPSKWTDIFSVLNEKPFFMPLIWNKNRCDDENNHNVDGEFIWTNPVDNTYINNIKYLKNNYTHYIASAHPGFKDCYGADASSVYTVVDHRNGDFLKERLQLAAPYDPPYLQLATWNDYGEGTMVEPTREFGYKFLNIIQQFAGVSCYSAVLPEIYNYYNLKKQYKNDEEKQKCLKQAFDYFVAMQPEEAIQILNSITTCNTETGIVKEQELAKISVYANNGIIHLSNLPVGKTLTIYNALGHLIHQTKTIKNEEVISNLNSGLYVISMDDYHNKVLVK